MREQEGHSGEGGRKWGAGRKCGCSGNLEHGVLMFGETITIAENAKSHNMKVRYEPRLNVIHNEHSTTGRIKSRKIVHYQWEAAKYTYNAYFGN